MIARSHSLYIWQLFQTLDLFRGRTGDGFVGRGAHQACLLQIHGFQEAHADTENGSDK